MTKADNYLMLFLVALQLTTCTDQDTIFSGVDTDHGTASDADTDMCNLGA